MRPFLLLCCVLIATTVPHPRAQTSAAAPVVTDVTAAQVMLDRLGFSSGEIDGRMGANVRGAINAFQGAQGLGTTGQLDADTWQRLTEHAGGLQPLVTYVIAEADVAGPFTTSIPKDLVEQSKLPALGYRNALEALGEKFHASPALLRQLNPQATFARAGEQITVPNVSVIDAPPASSEPPRGRGRGARGRGAAPVGTSGQPAVTIYVTKATSAVTVEDENHKVIFHAPVTSGSEHDPLPIGSWKVKGVQRNPTFMYNPDLFWDANPAHSKAKIPPGPNNPVGVLWIDLTKEHYGIHGTPEPANIGHAESHGCVRLTNWDAQRVAGWTRPGTPVIFR
jgi:lipoprotein-anchoring transpeptidase ErfK/SrfK